MSHPCECALRTPEARYSSGIRWLVQLRLKEGVSDQIKHLSGKVEAQDAQREEQVEDICTQIKGKYKSEALDRMTYVLRSCFMWLLAV